eukprot:gnl/TRDRNA2_/TRDRNA2_174718_c3_seq3.p1 gnl/TRDRNA2_/TRDRNA2_174718_c3~~gnl/TRDRNA2_/TRDRNA2_174718_c3_seq3.p1  ORF type:complete len:587 (+),score=120.50 gnl/TRDRNA2_/TRDRNA2_174718_c3_seq3:114-1763(+)
MEDAGALAEGYMSVLTLFRIMGKLAVLTYFTLTQTPSAWKCLIVMPTLMVVWGLYRNPMFVESNDAADEAKGEVLSFVQEASSAYGLIADYKQRPQTNEMFLEKLKEARAAEGRALIIACNNNWFCKWLGPVFTGLYIATQAYGVLNGNISLGKFLATSSIFGHVSDDFGEFYEQLMAVNGVISPLRGLAILFNMATDLKALKAVNRERRKETKEARGEALEKVKAMKKENPDVHPSPATDMLQIQIKDMMFSYVKDKPVFEHINATVPQGKLVGIEGGEASGKATLTKLLGQNIFPVSGEIFIPQHLRVLRVGQEPFILNQSAFKNLIFGDQGADSERVLEILQLLEMPVIKELVEADLRQSNTGPVHHSSRRRSSKQPKKKEEQVVAGRWYDGVPYTTKVKVSLARAFVMNPEVLVLHRPLAEFEGPAGSIMLSAIKQHCSKRGLCLPTETFMWRRPRTCFATFENSEQMAQADIEWKIGEVEVSEGDADVWPQGEATKRVRRTTLMIKNNDQQQRMTAGNDPAEEQQQTSANGGAAADTDRSKSSS